MTIDFEETFSAELSAVPDEMFDRSTFVPSVGPRDARLALVGEAPGAREVEQGEPFVGQAGRRLNDALETIGLDRDDVYVTNLVKVRPPENRDPTREEIDAWFPVLEAELAHVRPAVVVTLGAFASRELLGSDEPVSELRGTVHEGDDLVIVPTYHPAAAFYDDSVEPALVEDLRRAVEIASEAA